jgi:T5orf172 domain.
VKSNINRRQEIFRDVLPPVGTKAYLDAIEKLKKREQDNPGIKEFSKKSWEKVTKSLEAQYLSNCDFLTENSLRHFLTEFNNRAWKYGLRSMPVMFNIMEAFFNYRKPEIYFELIEEENYLISFFDFIDYITSKEFDDNKNLIDENITSDIIYNFNVGKDLEEIKFKNDADEEFIVAGVSIIRRENEITVLMVTGKKKTENLSIDKDSFKFDTQNPNKTEIIDEIKETLKTEEIEYEYIDEDKKFIKVLVAARIDLETMTIDARYVAEETNLMFNVVTDEIDGFLKENGDFISEQLKTAYENSREKIEGFNPIFEVIKLSLYLPYFFNSQEDAIVEEVLDTKFKKQFSSPLTKRKFNNVFGFKASTKSLYSIDTNNVLSPDKIKLRDDLFKVQTDGYWKKLGLDEIGLDKKGNPIHGRTWVNQNLSWFEANEEDLVVEKETELFKGKNAGFIYILRNPTMDKNIFKIGLTRNEVDDRVNQLSKTSVPDKFYKSQEWNVKDCVKAEKEIHSRLNDYRVDPRREFFKIDYDKAIKVIKEVIDEVNKE